MAKVERDPEFLAAAGLRLRAAREALGLKTHADLAAMLGITRTAVSNWENGLRLPDITAMMRLYERYQVPLEWIYLGDVRFCTYELGQALRARAALLAVPAARPGSLAATDAWPKIGARLRALRQLAALDKDTVAKLIGVKASDLAAAESGKTPLPDKALSVFATRFGATARFVLTGDPDKVEPDLLQLIAAHHPDLLAPHSDSMARHKGMRPA